MSLLQQIKDDQLQARKNRDKDKISLLTTLIGEASMPGKNDGNRESTDDEVVAIVKKFIKNMTEITDIMPSSVTAYVIAMNEIEMIEKYLPEQISGDKLVVAVKRACLRAGAESVRDMGKVMKELKDAHNGCYDGKEASGIVKELLK